jgi:DNA polymerase II small subunit/DNA polymerase delta subunit B
MKKLSILICSLKSRSESLTALLNSIPAINSMIDTYKEEAHDRDFYMCKIIAKDIEVVYCVDERQMTVGMKRNILLKNCSGEYVAYVDDDDKVVKEYAPELLQGIATGADVICFKAAYFVNSVFDRPVLYSAAYKKDWHDQTT